METNKTIRNSWTNSKLHYETISDDLYLIEVAPHIFIGSAQIEFRRYPFPEEQICKTKITRVVSYDKHHQDSPKVHTYVHPEFGFLTLANNIAVNIIKLDDPPSKNFFNIYRDMKLKIGDSLIWMNGAVDKVKVVDFQFCQNAFDPNQL
uniref:Uncharacterized protein n=1 Tax=Panagrolaimus superbus TaxID=310955 RepID=A0A914YCQ1_9BILA